MVDDVGTEHKKSFISKIAIAVIGVVGVLGAALIGNWQNIFPEKNNTEQRKGSASTPVNERNYSISGRVFQIGDIELSSVILDPPTESKIFPNEHVNITFNYKVCCNSSVYLWIRPRVEGMGCSYKYSGSPKYLSSGTGNAHFFLEGAGCKTARVRSLVFHSENIITNQENEFNLPVLYKGM